jgi:peptidoglycan/LPS O-acetylase OafA/YrhL
MSIATNIGCMSLGVVIGGMVINYVRQVRTPTLRSLVGSVSVFSGAAVLAFFDYTGFPPGDGVWYYPMGLLFGAIVVAALAWDHRTNKPRRAAPPPNG